MKKLTKVTRAIQQAVSMSNSVYDATREAAKLAAAQLDETVSIKARVDSVVALYADELAECHNVRANFSAMLLLLAAGSQPVSIATKAGDLHTTAAEAVMLPKNQMRDAAKEVREANGIGRKSGGGRKSADTTPMDASLLTLAKSAKAAKAAEPAPVEALSFTALVDRVVDVMNDEAFTLELAEALVERFKKKKAKALLEAVIAKL